MNTQTTQTYIITDGTTVVTVDNISRDDMRRIATSNCFACPFVNNCNLGYRGACAAK